jgi:hypothetical protein
MEGKILKRIFEKQCVKVQAVYDRSQYDKMTLGPH